MFVHNDFPPLETVYFQCASAAQNVSQLAYKTSNYMLGGLFRGLFFGKLPQTETTRRASQDFLSVDQTATKPMRQDVLKEFGICTKNYEFQIDSVSYQFQIKFYESKTGEKKHTCVRVGGRDETAETADVRVYPLLKAYIQINKVRKDNDGLNILQLSLHDHKVKREGEKAWSTWESGSAEETSRTFLAFLKHLRDERSICVDSLICHSLGSVILDAVNSQDAPLPKVLILDRALASVWKVGYKLYNPVVAYLLYAGAYIAGWGADPEKKLIQFFYQAKQQTTLSDRKVVVIEVKSDWYFSGAGAFSEDFTEQLSKTGVKTHRKCFDPSAIEYHARAHHALSLSKLKNGGELDPSETLPLQPRESASLGLSNISCFQKNQINCNDMAIIYVWESRFTCRLLR